MNLISWLKKNWAIVILAIIAVMWAKNYFFGYGSYQNLTIPTFDSVTTKSAVGMMDRSAEYAPTDTSNRLVIKDTSLSLQVKNVPEAIAQIESTAKSLGGYLVNSNLSKPDSIASGNITVRIPEEKRNEALDVYRKLSVKVVSENISGNDVTDQYVDLDARLAVLNKTKAKFEDILDRATAVSDLLNVQQQLVSLQSQIDSIRGQQKYLEQSSKLSLVSIYLSTDDLALPYAPSNEWRPAVVFKEAVRSLVGSFRNLGSMLIWVFVYSPIIIPILVVVWYIKRSKISH